MNYAIVPSRGRYSSGMTVRPLAVTSDRSKALRRAERATSEFRAAMRRYGYTSGGFRVVETEARSCRGLSWLGCDLDKMPTVSP
jgi:hypothetical protein